MRQESLVVGLGSPTYGPSAIRLKMKIEGKKAVQSRAKTPRRKGRDSRGCLCGSASSREISDFFRRPATSLASIRVIFHSLHSSDSLALSSPPTVGAQKKSAVEKETGTLALRGQHGTACEESSAAEVRRSDEIRFDARHSGRWNVGYQDRTDRLRRSPGTEA